DDVSMKPITRSSIPGAATVSAITCVCDLRWPGEIPRTLDGFLHKTHRPQAFVDGGEEVAAAFDEVEIERHEPHPSGGVPIDDQPIAAQHLFGSAERIPPDRSRPELV